MSDSGEQKGEKLRKKKYPDPFFFFSFFLMDFQGFGGFSWGFDLNKNVLFCFLNYCCFSLACSDCRNLGSREGWGAFPLVLRGFKGVLRTF